MGLNAPDLRDDCANGNRGVDIVNGAVRVAQDGDLADTEHCGGGSQLRFTNGRLQPDRRAFQASRSGRVLRVWL